MKKGRPPTGQEPAARRIFCWGGEEGGPPHPPGGKRGWAGRVRERDAAAAPGQPGGGDTKNLGSADRLADELPTRPAISRRETPGPGRRGAGGGRRAGVWGSLRPRARIGRQRGLTAGVGGRREASATAASPLRPAADQAARSPRPRRHTHPPPRPGSGGLPALPPAAAARPAPEIYLLIFWAKARRSAMAAKAAAAAALWARTGGRVPPRSRSLPRGLRQSQLRTGEAGAGGRSRERALP